jgi:two-component system, NarL family, response regulator LiaR
MMSKKIRLLLVSDQTLLGEGLRLLLADDPVVELVEQVTSGEEAVACYKKARPDVVVLCLEPQLTRILAVVASLRRLHTAVRIIILERATGAPNLVAAIQAGVMGYLLPGASLADLVEAVQTVYIGQAVLPPELTSQLIEAVKRPSPPATSADKLLTQREADIVCLAAQGLTNQEIADHLIISERTVRTHISHALLKLNLSNRTQLALYALRHGWVRLGEVLVEM